MLNFIRRHWYSLGLVFTALTLGYAFFGDLGSVQRILLLNFAVLTLHQFEEYGRPGGEAWITNEVMQPKGNLPDRYPLNQHNAFVMNVPLAWSFFLLPVFFPNMIWLGLAPTLFGFIQFVVHGVVTNLKLKTFYNPGLAAVVLGHVPVGIWYLVEVYSIDTISFGNWFAAIVYMACFMGIGMMTIGCRLLADENSPYPFARAEMERFDRDRRFRAHPK